MVSWSSRVIASGLDVPALALVYTKTRCIPSLARLPRVGGAPGLLHGRDVVLSTKTKSAWRAGCVHISARGREGQRGKPPGRFRAISRGRSRPGRGAASHVEAEVHDVAVGDDVVAALDAQPARLAGALDRWLLAIRLVA